MQSCVLGQLGADRLSRNCVSSPDSSSLTVNTTSLTAYNMNACTA